MDASHAELMLALEAIQLPFGQEYIKQIAGVEVERGRFDLQGQVKAMRDAGYGSNGSLRLGDFRAVIPDLYELEFELAELQVNGIALATEPLSLSIDSIALAEPNLAMS